uniref:Anaphase-promoting complex subunit 4 WD40 domain-containing protein n=1 Tax=Salix viminalis TaxID=40686 RepID=A0A6N2N3Q0_SALVM
MSLSRSQPNTTTTETILPGPPSRNNFSSLDLSSSNLLAFPSGSSISIVDALSLQLISTFPLPPPHSSTSSPALSPFITSVRFTPSPLNRNLLSTEPSSSHLLLAAADRHGRIALLDFRLKSVVLWLEPDPNPKSGIQDLCWILSRSDSYALAAISGPSSLSLYTTSGAAATSTASNCCFFKYEASPEFLSCIRRDPFDSRHFCVIGLKGLLLSVKVLAESENDVVVKEFKIPTDYSDLLRLEKDVAPSGGGVGGSLAPASAVFPLYSVKLAFSPQWRNILFVTFPRELVVFDLKYKTVLFSAALPRGCGKFLDVLPDPNNELLYCAHLDGKLSIWRRKEGEQVHVMCAMEELMPSIGTSVPSPSVLAVAICQSESTLQHVAKICSDAPDSPSAEVDFDNPFDFCDDSVHSTTHMISISDDGKVWNWLLTAEGTGDNLKDTVADSHEIPLIGDNANAVAVTDGLGKESRKQQEFGSGNKNRLPSTLSQDLSFRISLVGQLQLLSSTVTMLAVPSPSLIATLARGGSYPAVAVPLVALGTQCGTIDVVDVSANAVAASFSVHNSTVRGLRWLGNSRLVSFSYNQVSEKNGGYNNRLVVTCLRSGLNRPFRVLQKPERAPIRALRTSSSGRYLLILFRDAPVEVWAMTKTPIMLRSLALPFTVLEWTLPTVPRPVQNGPSKQVLWSSKDQTPVAQDGASTAKEPASESKAGSSDASQDDTAESFAFALVNGALGVFEVHGRRIRDFRPKWPSSSFVSSDGLITAMAYRLPHVVCIFYIPNYFSLLAMSAT